MTVPHIILAILATLTLLVIAIVYIRILVWPRPAKPITPNASASKGLPCGSDGKPITPTVPKPYEAERQ